MCRFIVNYVKKLSVPERILCVGVCMCVVLLLTIVLCLSLTMDTTRSDKDPVDIIIGRIVTREMWMAIPVNQTPLESPPVRVVLIHHAVSSQCTKLAGCAAELRSLQQYFMQHSHIDLPYNFLIGNDGRCYEGRGWGNVGAHALQYNKCSLGIGFIGDYSSDPVTRQQAESTQKLLMYAVHYGHVSADYAIMGGRDPRSQSPGYNLYKSIRQWPHYDGERYRNKTCKEIDGV